jgi:acyl-coenzyme A thioesterase PaaI-like protein
LREWTSSRDSIKSDVDSPSARNSHIVGELGFEHWHVNGLSHGRVAIRSEMLVPGTERVRIGLLAMLSDLVAGQPSSGPITPTTDLRVRVVRPAEMGVVHLVARTLKVGATLAVFEVRMTADDDDRPFALSLATFMNRSVDPSEFPEHVNHPLAQPLDQRIGARVLRPGLVQLDPSPDIANSLHGTVQGGVLAMLGELAAESAVEVDGPFVVSELDIRFLNRVKVGPVQAGAEVLSAGPGGCALGVSIGDTGNDDRSVAYVAAFGSPVR